ncbi:UNVERIFIED_CONTAM: hypothetical protein B566_EDAN018674 [Ephemera danica]|nr:hypothetical protein B566_EDAN018674 [Ephemera danica]
MLTGCCDKIVRAYDCRTDNTFLEFPVPGEVERVAWNHFNSFYFLTSTDAGNIHCFDTRNQKQLWQINQAHSKEVTGLSLSCSCPGLLVTGSMDGRLLIWDILDASQDAPPTLVDEKALSVGAIYTVQTSPDAPFVPASTPQEEMETEDTSESFRELSIAGPSTSNSKEPR